MKLSEAQLAELERIREWACCLEPERRFMAEAENAALKREFVEHLMVQHIGDIGMSREEAEEEVALITAQSEDGFFCQKCGTVYTEIMACRTCQPEDYERLKEQGGV